MINTGLSGFVVTMHLSMCKQYVQSFGLLASHICENITLQDQSIKTGLRMGVHALWRSEAHRDVPWSENLQRRSQGTTLIKAQP